MLFSINKKYCPYWNSTSPPFTLKVRVLPACDGSKKWDGPKMRFCLSFCKMKKKNWEMKKNPTSQHRFCWAKWRKKFQNEENFSSFYKFMLNYTQKPHKLKKALCTFIFLFFNAQNYSCCSKISKRLTRESQMGTRESQNGHSGPLKSLALLVISKLALLPILKIFLIEEREK